MNLRYLIGTQVHKNVNNAWLKKTQHKLTITKTNKLNSTTKHTE